jgi:hypothetical protein
MDFSLSPKSAESAQQDAADTTLFAHLKTKTARTVTGHERFKFSY